MYCIIFRFTASARDQQVGERAASNDGDRIFVVIGTEFICFSLLLHQIIAVPTITIYLGPSFNCQWIFVFVCGFVAPRVTLSCGCDFVVFCVCWPWQRSVIVQFIQRPTMHKNHSVRRYIALFCMSVPINAISCNQIEQKKMHVISSCCFFFVFR